KSKVNTVDDVSLIVNHSTTNSFNISQRYLNGDGFQIVFYKDKIEDEYKNITILPPIINTRPLSLKRQEELYKEIAPYVDIPFYDITCSKPNANESEEN
ncbi:23542_t:CDS:2, partial [Dentiscutata erythropus]